MFIKSYNSTRSLSDYSFGDINTFYVHNTSFERLSVANETIIKKYSSKLIEIINDDSFSNNDGKYLNFTRVIGIVVDKHESTNDKDSDKITVMFKTDDDRYVLNKYVVNSIDVFTNNKDFISPSAMIYIA